MSNTNDMQFIMPSMLGKHTRQTLRKRDVSTQKRVASFLMLPVPPFPSEQSELWKQEAIDLGKSAIPILIDALANGDWNEQYAALLALRYLGVAASARGYGHDLVYEVDLSDDETVPGTGVIIKPKIADSEYEDMVFEAVPTR